MTESLRVYLRLRGMKPLPRRRRRSRTNDDANQPFTQGRDPHTLDGALDSLIDMLGWTPHLEREGIALHWTEIAGAENAAHSYIEMFSGGTIVVRCDSTARASQMRLMRAHFMTKVHRLYPQSGATDIRFQGPDQPSWSHGERRVPGRGPRDTYG